MFPGFKSRNRRPVAISAAIWNLSCQGRAGNFPRRRRQSSKLPLVMYSYTKQPYSGHAPRRRTMFGCLIQIYLARPLLDAAPSTKSSMEYVRFVSFLLDFFYFSRGVGTFR
ncbi:hypothetical protein Ahy_A05g023392 [Arachis hypogaea]|uniref:Uncharacterized protein n=1 Tax=Arachis hypogaea TaxID=3818 RepID=A0A445D3I2_ARAHY|nr:hypothetical protein Ahy_A05g023392 [Arachis hypogaea]